MHRRSQHNASVLAEAAAWLARLHADDRSLEDERAFHAWIGADPQHAVAFEAVSNMWDTIGGLPRDLRGYVEKRPVSNRRQWIATVGALALLGSTALVWHPAEAEVYQTKVGEQRRIVLRDGSRVLLDTNTRLKVYFSKSLRAVELQYGRANFHVSPDPRRAFVVRTGDREVVVTSSNFDVRRDDKRISVVLIRGSAFLKSANSRSNSETLHVGERLVATATDSVRLDKPNLVSLLAWQTGHAVFENEKLSDAVYEMNRYSAVKLEIGDPVVARTRISGIYRLGDSAAFANSVSKLLPVRVQTEPGRVLLTIDTTRLREG